MTQDSYITTTYSDSELHDIVCDYLIMQEDRFTFCGICNHIFCHARNDDRTSGCVCPQTDNPLTAEEQARVKDVLWKMLGTNDIYIADADAAEKEHDLFNSVFCRTYPDGYAEDIVSADSGHNYVQAPAAHRTVSLSECNEDLADAIDRCFIIPRSACDLHTITQNITAFFRNLESEYYIDRIRAVRNHAQALVYTLDCTAWHYHTEAHASVATGICDTDYICRFAGRELLRIMASPDTPEDVRQYIIHESGRLLSHPSFARHNFFDIRKFATEVRNKKKNVLETV
ncbi:hypothetical protein [Xylanibacter muris]|uniref:Uncharacterized protein n=1 Tax=Xylanibacter muris TaxID=2736290 RepID=A0ABX2ANP0_9BACT|nr:hypothetical protein [Xylanibacter muris]NPD91642.1 hypothetical protein [Xylanibacter muris]